VPWKFPTNVRLSRPSCGSSWAAGAQPCLGRICEAQRQVADKHRVGGGAAQLARQAVIAEPYPGVRFPRVAEYLVMVVGWRKHWGKLDMRISRLNTRVPGGSSIGERSSRLS
jgi:hypothetical protein